MDVASKKTLGWCSGILFLLLLLEFICIQAQLFEQLPHAGIVFHVVGGMVVGIGFYTLFQLQLKHLTHMLQLISVMGAVCLAAVGWEGFEWVFSLFYHNNLQGSLNNTMGDMYVGLLGGLVAAMCIVIKERKI
jgi:uncharacterized membrane-anchored protein